VYATLWVGGHIVMHASAKKASVMRARSELALTHHAQLRTTRSLVSDKYSSHHPNQRRECGIAHARCCCEEMECVAMYV
jgi:hypothetical protein